MLESIFTIEKKMEKPRTIKFLEEFRSTNCTFDNPVSKGLIEFQQMGIRSNKLITCSGDHAEHDAKDASNNRLRNRDQKSSEF